MEEGSGVIATLVGIALVLTRKPLAQYIARSGLSAGSRGDRLKVAMYQLVAVIMGVAFFSVGLLILLGIVRPAS